MSKKNLYFEDEVMERKFNFQMLKNIVSYAEKYKKTYFLVMLFLVLNSVLSMIPATLNMMLINHVLPKSGVLSSHFQTYAIVLVSVWASVMIGQVITAYLNNRMTIRLGTNIVSELRNDMFKKLMDLSFDYYDTRPSGKSLVRITSYCAEVSSIFIDHLTNIIVNLFKLILSLVVVCFLQIHLMINVLAIELPLLVIVYLLVRGLQKAARITRNKNSNRTAFVAEDISGVDVIHAFNRADLNSEILCDLTDQTNKCFMFETHFREAIFPMAHGIIRMCCSVIIYVSALAMIQKNPASLTLGVIISVTTYMELFANAVFELCQRLQNITTLTTNLERIFELMYEEPAIKDSPDAAVLPPIKGHVCYKDVSFGYVPGINVLEHVDLDVKPGEMIALVGPTGAGKTTLISLLSRFYDVTGGEITIDGHNIKDVTLQSLRRQVCTMMQDTFLFSREVIENIRFSKPDATDEECIAAAKKVSADEFITRLPHGYHTRLSKQGSELSGGERQLLSFARLILADPKILILDEATSNIDSETEAQIQEMLKVVLKGRTSFVIAHRLSTIKNADRILYIDDKHIVEMGSHDELMAKKGHYYQLIQKEK